MARWDRGGDRPTPTLATASDDAAAPGMSPDCFQGGYENLRHCFVIVVAYKTESYSVAQPGLELYVEPRLASIS